MECVQSVVLEYLFLLALSATCLSYFPVCAFFFFFLVYLTREEPRQIYSTMNLDFRRPRPRIQIDLDRPSLHTFTTGDHINGTATLTVDHELQFDDLEITFEGKPNPHTYTYI